ncbi:hypothetical protein CR66_07425 [Campylobacter mucosalis]|nr:hypothetical protein CR66_07425 [Campylobacter mucosalis]
MKILNEQDKKYLLDSIRAINDFPKPGIVFRDITTLLNDQKAFSFLMQHLTERYRDYNLDFIVA